MTVLSLLQSRRTPVGLDIGTGGFRAVQLRRVDGGFEVRRAARGAAGSTSSAANATGGSEASKQIQMLLTQRGFSGKEIVTAMDPAQVEFHALEIPPGASEGETGASSMIQFEVARLMNRPPDQIESRYWSVPRTAIPAPNAIGIGAARKAIEQQVQMIDAAGFRCSCIDLDAAALHRFAGLLSDYNDSIWGALDIGERHARLILSVDDQPVLVRRVGPGGKDWTQRVAEALQISSKAAEVHKCDQGISSGSRAVDDASTAANELPGLLLNALRPLLTDLAGEIKRSYEYVLNCYAGKKAGDLVLLGGGSRLQNLPEFLGRALGINVQRASAYLNTGGCKLRDPTRLAAPLELYGLAIGLAI